MEWYKKIKKRFREVEVNSVALRSPGAGEYALVRVGDEARAFVLYDS